MDDFDRGIENFIKRAGLSNADAQVVRENVRHIDPIVFGQWYEKEAGLGSTLLEFGSKFIGKAAPKIGMGAVDAAEGSAAKAVGSGIMNDAGQIAAMNTRRGAVDALGGRNFMGAASNAPKPVPAVSPLEAAKAKAPWLNTITDTGAAVTPAVAPAAPRAGVLGGINNAINDVTGRVAGAVGNGIESAAAKAQKAKVGFGGLPEAGDGSAALSSMLDRSGARAEAAKYVNQGASGPFTPGFVLKGMGQDAVGAAKATYKGVRNYGMPTAKAGWEASKVGAPAVNMMYDLGSRPGAPGVPQRPDPQSDGASNEIGQTAGNLSGNTIENGTPATPTTGPVTSKGVSNWLPFAFPAAALGGAALLGSGGNGVEEDEE